MIDIIKHISKVSGVTEEVINNKWCEKGIGKKILTLVWYGFATDGDSWTGLYNWTIRYLKLLPYNNNPITEDIYDGLF